MVLVILQPKENRSRKMVRVMLQLKKSRYLQMVLVILQPKENRSRKMVRVMFQLKESRYLMMVQVILQPKKRLLKVKINRNQNSLMLPTLARTQKKSSSKGRGIS